ncbi:MAG TPA: 4'-phosphopantetheinyl transferase superfamily protein [Candidatus Babeliales bacterium]|nr:4'-phosphopantetheinyl transferase superfamily protein [Candidatus Babeliales bacterium]
MILSIGIDSLEIDRFSDFACKTHTQLKHLFSEAEIAYCLSNQNKTAERFAVRFAAKEAFYKAIHQLLPEQKLPLFTVCANVEVIAAINGAPQLLINWAYFREYITLPEMVITHISTTHSKTLATAFVIIEAR